MIATTGYEFNKRLQMEWKWVSVTKGFDIH